MIGRLFFFKTASQSRILQLKKLIFYMCIFAF